MLLASGYVLGLTSLAGLLLFAIYGRTRVFPRIWLPGAIHGAMGLAGAILLAAGLRGATRTPASGTGSFGLVSVVLVAGALLAGGVVFVRRLRLRGPPAALLGIHATLAVAGLVMLAAYLSAGN